MKKNKTLSRVVMAAGVTAMTVGLAVSFNIIEAEASGGGGRESDLEFVPTKCVTEEDGITVILGESNDCKPGTSYCADNDCSRFR